MRLSNWVFFSLILISQFAGRMAYADDLKPLKRWAVFPFASADEKLKFVVDEAWWKCREKITEKKRFLVASKQLLIEKDLYTPRKTLSPDDVKYLAQLLDADVIVTGFSEYRDFTLNVYFAQTGQLLWSGKQGFHPSLKAEDQLMKMSQRLVAEMLRQIPYEGQVVNIDEKVEGAVAVDVGNNLDLKEGDDIQFIEITFPAAAKPDEPLGFEKIKTFVTTEGKVTQVKKNYVLVSVKKSLDALVPGYFVSVPRERKQIGYQDTLAPEMLPSLDDDSTPEPTHSKQVVVFGSIFSFLGLLLLAF